MATALSEQTPTAPRLPLRLLCLHGHGGNAQQFCSQLEDVFFKASTNSAAAEDVSFTCRCMSAPFPMQSQHSARRRWWRYDEGGNGDYPNDWAEMEVAATRIAEELCAATKPYDGVLGMSQGAEMVHTLAVLAHRGDPRFCGAHMPRFVISLSGAVNPGLFESPSGGGPPKGCEGPHAGPGPGRLALPCLFLADYQRDHWYPAGRWEGATNLYADCTVVEHAAGHTVPSLHSSGAALLKNFVRRSMKTK